MQKILITGCSSGFGLATARHFLDQGWEVIATMRTPRPEVLPTTERLQILPLDVTDPASIAAVAEAAGPLDALVNNAGVGLLNVVEGTTIENAREVFETNVLGPIALTKALLPRFRARGGGVIVNVSSSVTLRPLPALSVYSASKAALNAFTESFAHEAALYGIRTRLVLPGSAPETSFGQNAVARMGMEIPAPYQEFVRDWLTELRASTQVTRAEDVARAVWQAVTELDAPARIPAGEDAVSWFNEARLSAA